jgi:hypothetical protein
MTIWKGEPEWSTKQLLEAIKTEAVRGGTNGNLTYLAPAVAALVIKLSNAADHQAKIIERWTKAVVWLTIVLVMLTIALVYKEFAPDLPKLH